MALGYQMQVEQEKSHTVNSIWKRRSRFEVIADILRVVRKRGTKARVMLSARVNGAIAGEYLNLLQNGGLLRRVDGENQPYLITERGTEYLEVYDSLNNLLSLPVISKISDESMYQF